MNTGFSGNQQNIRYFSEAYEKEKLTHAYILEGSKDSGKEAFAQYLAAALLCEKAVPGRPLFSEARACSPLDTCGQTGSGKTGAPCGTCPACIKAATGNHPDLIHVHHEKSTVLSVQEIREQVVSDISVKPYYGPYKIYIIHDAQLMNENAQNALLKTIEEPESYGLLLLLTDNADGFLQTILSRCVRISMDLLPRTQVAEHLLDEDGRKILQQLTEVRQMDALAINKVSKEWEGMDQQQIMEILQLWFRDVLVYKSTKDRSRLFFIDQKAVPQMAERFSYEGLNQALAAVDAAQARLKASVKAEAVYETLLLTIRTVSRETKTKGTCARR